MRAGLSLAGWNPRHSDMKKMAAEWWNWGELFRIAVAIYLLAFKEAR